MNRSFKFGEFPKKIDSTAVILNTIYNMASIDIKTVPFKEFEENLVKFIPDLLETEKETTNGLLYASVLNYIYFDKEKKLIHIVISKEEAIEKLSSKGAPVLVKKEKDK